MSDTNNLAASLVAGALTPAKARQKSPEQQARLDAYIKKTVDRMPPLTEEQRDRLAGLLRVKK